MFVHNIDPTLFQIGFIEVRFYGIVYALGFLLTYYFLLWQRDRLKITKDQAETLILYTMIGLVAGARLFFFAFERPGTLITDPLEFFAVWHGGMSFFGGLTGSIVAVYYFWRKLGSKTRFLAFGDVIVVPATIALILGRIANFINSELVGTVSSVPWCVVFSRVDELCRHPYQIYASVSHMVLLAMLLLKKGRAGSVFWTFLLTYPVLRFITDFFRYEPRILGLTLWQYVSLAFFLIAFWRWNIWRTESK
ncbi:MAG: prolipoprotein diacylglyceryl transferase [archaeon]